MHASELIELAAVVAAQSQTLIHGVQRFPAEGIALYWSASKCRLNRWGRSLKAYSSHTAVAHEERREAHWQSVRPAIEEILISEILTRVWTCVVAAHDRLRGTNEVEPVMRSVLTGHLEARNRALNAMVYGYGFGVAEAVDLNRLRRRCERWTDLLLGYMADQQDVAGIAFDADRCREFAADLRHDCLKNRNELAGQMIVASLRSAFGSGTAKASPNGDLNQQIAAGILASVPTAAFDSTGFFHKSLWLLRLGIVANEAQAMLDQLLSPDDPPADDRFFARV